MLQPLPVEEVLSNIDQQTSRLKMNRNDIARLSDINTISYLNNFTKKKIPMFSDLYRVSLAIGMTVDDLLTVDEKKRDNPHNILHWFKGKESHINQSSLINFISDKVAVAHFLNNLNEKTTEIAGLQVEVVTNLLLLNEADFLFLYNSITQTLPYYRGTSPLYRRSSNMYEIWDKSRALLEHTWTSKGQISQYLWQSVEKNIPKYFNNKTQFLKTSGISTKTYTQYIEGEANSTPNTDKVIKVCNLLGIDSIDATIRDNLPKNVFTTKGVDRAYSNEDLPYLNDKTLRAEILQKHVVYKQYYISMPEVREHLTALPNLGVFIDQLLTLPLENLRQISSQIKSSLEHPFTSFAYQDLIPRK